MRRFSIVLLLSALAAPLLGGWVWLEVEKKLVKRAVKHRILEGLDDAELTRLAFTPEEIRTELEWEHDREFEFRGVMYDVVRRIETADSVVLWCWPDHAETALNQRLREQVLNALQNDPGRQERQQELVFFFKTLFWENGAGVGLTLYAPENPLVATEKTATLRCWTAPPGPPPKNESTVNSRQSTVGN